MLDSLRLSLLFSTKECCKALYSGFTGIYSAYNPSYTNEGKPGLPNKLIDEIFVPGFANKQFRKAHYLFFIEDDDGLNHLKVFRALMKKVERFPNLPNKLEVRQIRKRCSDDVEFYLGTKEANLCHIETKDASPNDRGNPRFYLVVNDKGINLELRAHFDLISSYGGGTQRAGTESRINQRCIWL